MSSIHKNDDSILDRAIEQVAGEPIDPAQVEMAASRVWERLAQGVTETPMAQAEAPAPASLRGCDDFQALIPAYLRGELPQARALLLEDHTRGCVPCRRALREAREGKTHETVRPAAKASRFQSRQLWMGLAAALVIALGFGLVLAVQEMLAGGSKMARVESIDGGLYMVNGETSRPLGAGDTLDEGQEVRTAKASHAMLRMADGSLIEMSERASVALDAGRKGNTIQLAGGRVIVQAAKQRQRHLFVQTGDALVSVTGTIFSVNSGTKGTRVSVLEGEVRVKQTSRDSILHPGDQVTTHASVVQVPIRREIAWSKDARRYDQLLAELAAAGKDIDAQVERPGLRYSTKLLDLAPEGTRIYVALPNLSKSLADTQRLLDQKIAASPSLRNWWGETLRSSENEEKFRELIAKIGDLGQYLGDEVAVAIVDADEKDGKESGPVFLAEVTDEAAFRAVLEREASEIAGKHAGKQVLHILDSPTAAIGDSGDSDGMYAWVGSGLFIASPSGQQLAQVAANLESTGTNPFVSSSFHHRIAQSYQDGAGWLFAADLHTLMAEKDGKAHDADAEVMGLYDMEYFILDRRETGDKVETRAALTFDQQRRGVASWIAAPSSMGSIGFFSPDANLVGAFVVKNPVTILDEMLSIKPELAQELAKIKAEQGIDVREDLAAPLGGEVAFGIDGPLVPTPSWKLVVEVLDPARLQHTIGQAVARCNDELRQNGKPQIQLTEERASGRSWYTIAGNGETPEVHYVYEDGYLVAAPSRALVERALQQRASGVTLAGTPKLRDLLGEDGQVNVSALLYRNLAPLAESAGKILPQGVGPNGRGPRELANLLLGEGPSVVYGYAEADRILFGSSGDTPLGFNLQSLAGLGSVMGMAGNLHDEAEQNESAH